MSKYLKIWIKVSLKQIPVFVKTFSLIALLYCMISSIRYANLGFAIENFGYPTLSYNYMVYGMTIILYINHIFIIYNDKKTSLMDLIIISKKRLKVNNYILKNIIMIFFFILPLFVISIPVYLRNIASFEHNIPFIIHLGLSIFPAVLMISYAIYISTTPKSGIYYCLPIIYLLFIDPMITLKINWKFSMTAYLNNYAIISGIEYIYILVVMEIIFSVIFIFLSNKNIKGRKNI